MKLSLKADNILEFLALKSGKLPEPLLELYFSLGISSTLVTAIKEGIFELIEQGINTPEAISREVGIKEEGARTLLEALNGFGYLRRKSGKFYLTRKIKAGFFPYKESYLLMADIVDWFTGLEGILKSGKERDFHQKEGSQFWEHYLMGIYKFSKIAAKEVAFRLGFRRGRGKILDPGGGHGLYTATLLKMNRSLEGVIIDLPPACDIGRRIIEKEGLSERVIFVEGDMREVEWGKGYDLILFFNIIHIFTHEENEMLFNKAYRALKNGGRIAVLDSEFPERENLSTIAGFNQLLFYLINGTRVYNEDLITGWVKDAGFKRIRKSRLLSVPMTFFLTAEKKE